MKKKTIIRSKSFLQCVILQESLFPVQNGSGTKVKLAFVPLFRFSDEI